MSNEGQAGRMCMYVYVYKCSGMFRLYTIAKREKERNPDICHNMAEPGGPHTK